MYKCSDHLVITCASVGGRMANSNFFCTASHHKRYCVLAVCHSSLPVHISMCQYTSVCVWRERERKREREREREKERKRAQFSSSGAQLTRITRIIGFLFLVRATE